MRDAERRRWHSTGLSEETQYFFPYAFPYKTCHAFSDNPVAGLSQMNCFCYQGSKVGLVLELAPFIVLEDLGPQQVIGKLKGGATQADFYVAVCWPGNPRGLWGGKWLL